MKGEDGMLGLDASMVGWFQGGRKGKDGRVWWRKEGRAEEVSRVGGGRAGEQS